MVGISGIGVYIPGGKIDIQELNTQLSLEERNKIGIKSVFYESKLTATQMAVVASREAVVDAGISPLDIDLIINTQSSLHDYLMWQVSAAIQYELQACNSSFFDIYQGCSGFIVGLITSKQYLLSGDVNTVLVNTSEKWDESIKDRLVGKLAFGEGGVAAIIQRNSNRNFILGYSIICRGNLNDVSRMNIGTINPPNKDNRNDCYYRVTNLLKAKQEMIPINTDMFFKVGEQAIKNSGLSIKDINHIIFPNVGFGLFEKVANRFGIPLSNSNHRYVDKTGDCATVDALMSYYRMLEDEIIKKKIMF